MRKMLIGLCLAASLSACGPALNSGIVPGPNVVSDRTKVDEQAGITVTLAYVAASKLAGLAIETGLVKDKVTIQRIGLLDRQAFDAVSAVRAAYDAGNAASYADALVKANVALKAFSDLVPGRKTSAVDAPSLNAAFALASAQRGKVS
jgi:hypothetical protein